MNTRAPVKTAGDREAPGAAGAGTGGPLAGVRVIDLTSVVVGPFATQILADHGADVIKVEAPGGDQGRYLSGAARHHGMAWKYLHLNRNKRSIVLDLKQPDGHQALVALLRGADVLVYNIRPRAMARLKLSWEDVHAINPRLIYAGAFGFGQGGRYAARPAYDPMLQGLSGSVALNMAATGSARYVPFMLADRSVGLIAAYAITMALFERSRTGIGQAVEVPMFENMVGIQMAEHLYSASFAGPDVPGGSARVGDPRLLDPNFRPARTRDGFLCISLNTDRQAHAFFDVIGRPELKTDPRFGTMTARAANAADWLALRAEVLAERTNAHWVDVLSSADIPHAPVQSLDEVLADPHLADVGLFQRVQHASEGELVQIGVPNTFSASGAPAWRGAPRLGEHTREILREAGYDAPAIAALLASGAANAPD